MRWCVLLLLFPLFVFLICSSHKNGEGNSIITQFHIYINVIQMSAASKSWSLPPPPPRCYLTENWLTLSDIYCTLTAPICIFTDFLCIPLYFSTDQYCTHCTPQYSLQTSTLPHWTSLYMALTSAVPNYMALGTDQHSVPLYHCFKK